jgi:serine/threonine-protein kinase
VLNVASGKWTILVHGGTSPHYARSGHIVYAVGGTLRAIAFDLKRLEVTGNPIPVVEHVLAKPTGAADFALAQNGTLVYVSGTGQRIGVLKDLRPISRRPVSARNVTVLPIM